MLKTHVLLIAKYFPATHTRAGELTHFCNKIKCVNKIHTIRANYGLWKKRVDEVNAGIASLSLREWIQVPYKSKQNELLQYRQLGIQKLQLDPLGFFIEDVDSDVTIKELAQNDGLSVVDFKAWFKKTPLNEPMAIIHFTNFKYSNSAM